MQAPFRSTFLVASIALLMVASFAAVATAQVATLSAPDETPEPELDGTAIETELEFADRAEALLVFAQCMRDNGIDMDDPEPGARGGGFFRRGPGSGAGAFDVQGEEFQAAQQACGPILEAARPDIDPEAEAQRLEQNLAMAQCFRDHGYPEYPDPFVGSDGRLQRFGGRQLQEIGIDPRSEAFVETRESCAGELGVEFGPAGRRGPGGDL